MFLQIFLQTDFYKILSFDKKKFFFLSTINNKVVVDIGRCVNVKHKTNVMSLV